MTTVHKSIHVTPFDALDGLSKFDPLSSSYIVAPSSSSSLKYTLGNPKSSVESTNGSKDKEEFNTDFIKIENADNTDVFASFNKLGFESISPRPLPAAVKTPRRHSIAHIPQQTDSPSSSATSGRAKRRHSVPNNKRRASLPHPSQQIDTQLKPPNSTISADPSGSPLSPIRRCHAYDSSGQCHELVIAHNLCATHLLSRDSDLTPTSRIRSIYNLWNKRMIENKDLQTKHHTWKFICKGDSYSVELYEDEFTGERTVVVCGHREYHSHPDPGYWTFNMVLGRSNHCAFESILEISSTNTNNNSMNAELWIEGFPFVEAHANWLSQLGNAYYMQKLEKKQNKKYNHNNNKIETINANTISKDEHYEIINEFLTEQKYVKENWKKSIKLGKTSLNNPKIIIQWLFTINRKKHIIILEHSIKSGKKKILLNNKIIYEKKSGIKSVFGILQKKFKTQQFVVDNLKCDIQIYKNENYNHQLKQTMNNTDFSSNLSNNTINIISSNEIPFIYDLSIDNVPFKINQKTIIEYAGGDLTLDQLTKSRESTNNTNNNNNKLSPEKQTVHPDYI